MLGAGWLTGQMWAVRPSLGSASPIPVAAVPLARRGHGPQRQSMRRAPYRTLA